MLRVLVAMTAAGMMAASAGPLVYFGSWPKTVVVLDEANGSIVDRITLATDAARTLLPTHDKKRLIAITVKDAGIETIDLETRKVVDSFLLGSETKRVRLSGTILDPTRQFLYITMSVSNKLIDRFQSEPPKFAIVDLKEKKITRTVDLPREVAPSPRGGGGGRGSGQMRISPDGKYLWFFRENIYIVDTTDFKIVQTIPMERPEIPGMESISLSGSEDPNDDPGKLTAIFNTSDPIVHKRVFGIAEIDLNTRKIDYTPIGPAVAGMNGSVRLSPDKKFGYGVTISGQHGDRFCEFFIIDMKGRKIVKRAEFPGRTRFNTTLTTDGKYVVVYGAGHTLELYDSTTLQFSKQIDVNADMTTGLVPVMPVAAR
jgi:hypothetical protein